MNSSQKQISYRQNRIEKGSSQGIYYIVKTCFDCYTSQFTTMNIDTTISKLILSYFYFNFYFFSLVESLITKVPIHKIDNVNFQFLLRL